MIIVAVLQILLNVISTILGALPNPIISSLFTGLGSIIGGSMVFLNAVFPVTEVSNTMLTIAIPAFLVILGIKGILWLIGMMPGGQGSKG